MRKLLPIIMSGVMSISLLTPLYAADHDEDISRSSRPSLAKTLFTGMLLMSAPTSVIADIEKPSYFVGCYLGEIRSGNVSSLDISKLSMQQPCNLYLSPSDNMIMSGTSYRNWAMFPDSSVSASRVGKTGGPGESSPLNIKIDCIQENHCNSFYIRAVSLCRKIFNVKYYADMIFTSPSSSKKIALSIWNSSKALNTSEFEETFEAYMNTVDKNGITSICPPNSTYSSDSED